MVNEENKMLPVEDEKAELAEVADLIDEITPDLEELSGRMARIRQLLNSEDTSPKERREALKTIGEIFKYGMCEGFDSMYVVPVSDDDGKSEEVEVRYLQDMMKNLTRKEKKIRLWANAMGISDSLECGVIVGVLMWKILVAMTELVMRRRKEADR